VRYAKKVATTASGGDERHRVREKPGIRPRGGRAGLRYAYLQFDGMATRQLAPLVGNLFDVKLRAIENCGATVVDIVPVTTIVNA
jgi:uncharacterized radical SAM superfamily Fe-S cluster-containing enzyme